MNKPIPVTVETDEPKQSTLVSTILEFVGQIPSTSEALSERPEDRAGVIARAAAAKAALAAGALALPPGPFGWMTIFPELIAIWRLQAQMVADIAGTFGKDAALTREQMLYCLFRHAAAQAVRDLVVRVGERYLVRRAPLSVFHKVATAVGVRVSRRVIGKGVSRWIPVVGALGVAGYAYRDTVSVAKTATDLFGGVIDLEPEGVSNLPSSAR